MTPHVRTETRKVYVSVRGTKLTKHAAYIAAAKDAIARRCRRWDDERLEAVTSTDTDGYAVSSESYEPCSKDGPYQCRFHARHTQRTDLTGMGHYDDEPIGMAYYRRVLPRLVRFLKFVDRRRGEQAREQGIEVVDCTDDMKRKQPAPCRHPKAARKKTLAMSPMRDAYGFDLRWTEICGECKGRRPLGTRGVFKRAPKQRSKRS